VLHPCFPASGIVVARSTTSFDAITALGEFSATADAISLTSLKLCVGYDPIR